MHYIIYLLLVSSLGFDIAVNFLKLPALLPQIYKICIMLLISLHYFRTKSRILLPLVSVTITFFLGTLSYNYTSGSFLVSLQQFNKLIYVPLTVLFIPRMYMRNLWSKKQIYLIVAVGYITLLVNFLLGIWKGGYSSYNDVGTKGYIAAGNELSGALLIVTGTLFIYLFNTNKKILAFAVYIISLTIGLSLGTKVGIFAISLYFIAAYAIANIHLFSHRKRLFHLVLIAALIPLLAHELKEFFINTNAVGRFIYIANNDGIESLIFSGRTIGLSKFYNYIQNADLLTYLFGVGPVSAQSIAPNIEMDIIDTFFFFGINGSLWLIIFYYSIFKYLNNNHSENRFIKKSVVLLNLLILFISVLSGHIIYSPLLAVFWGSMNSLILFDSNSQYYHPKSTIEK